MNDSPLVHALIQILLGPWKDIAGERKALRIYANDLMLIQVMISITLL